MLVISKGVVFSVAMLGVMSFIPNSFAIPADPHFYVKGTADQYGPFAGNYARILVDGEKGTILFTTAHGLAIVRMNLSDVVMCYNKTLAVCLNGMVSSVKNVAGIHIGDIIRISADTSGKWHVITFLTGDRSVSEVSVKLNPVKNSISDQAIQQSFFSLREKETKQPNLVSYYMDEQMIDAVEKVRQFTVTHPTFMYDGIPSSLDLTLVSVIDGEIPAYVVEVNFDSEHPGFGDRSDQKIANVLTHHTMTVIVSNYGIGSAIIDGIWDEFNQGWKK